MLDLSLVKIFLLILRSLLFFFYPNQGGSRMSGMVGRSHLWGQLTPLKFMHSLTIFSFSLSKKDITSKFLMR